MALQIGDSGFLHPFLSALCMNDDIQSGLFEKKIHRTKITLIPRGIVCFLHVHIVVLSKSELSITNRSIWIVWQRLEPEPSIENLSSKMGLS